MIEYKSINFNGVQGSYNLKNGQFIPDCCMNCSRLVETVSPSCQHLKTCGIHIFLPVASGVCKRQIPIPDPPMFPFAGD